MSWCAFSKKSLRGVSVYSGPESNKKHGNHDTKSDNASTAIIKQMLAVKLLSHHCTKFVSYESCWRGKTTFLFCHVISWDQKIINLLVKLLSRYCKKFVAYDSCWRGGAIFLFCHVMLCDHKIICMWLEIGVLQYKSRICQVWCLKVLLRDIIWPHHPKNMWLGKWEPRNLSPLATGFGVYRSEDITFHLVAWHQVTILCKKYVTYEGVLLNLSHHCTQFDGWCLVLWKCRYNVSILSRQITLSHDQREMWLGRWERFNLSHHCAKFVAYGSCGREICFYFVGWYNITTWSKGHMTCLVIRSPSTYIITVPSLMLKGLVEMDIWSFLFCHITSRGHMIKRTCDVSVGFSQHKLPI